MRSLEPVKTDAVLYRCPNCAQIIEVPPDLARARAMFSAASGRSNERVILASGVEVHRCPIPRPSTMYA